MLAHRGQELCVYLMLSTLHYPMHATLEHWQVVLDAWRSLVIESKITVIKKFDGCRYIKINKESVCSYRAGK